MSNEPLTRKDRERSRHRREILIGARSVFVLKGFADTTMEEIARTAEFGKGTIYRHFSSKEELLVVVIEEMLREQAGTVAEAIGIEDAVATIRRIFLCGAFTPATGRNPERSSTTQSKTL